MSNAVQRRSVDLTSYPNLVVVYLGFQVTQLRGIRSMYRLNRGLSEIARAYPDGLLRHERIIYGLTHIGMRQYWRDFESLETFTRSEPHSSWWKAFLRDSGGAGFWHETYRMRGGMEAIYIDMPEPTGFATFAPPLTPQGAFATARGRLAA